MAKTVSRLPAAAPSTDAVRDGDGRWKAGVSGNPQGRPPLPREVREMLAAASPRATQRLIELMEDPDPRVAAMCANAVLDRLYGRPSQAVDANITQTTTIQQAHLRALQEIARRRETAGEGARVINVRPPGQGQ